MAHITKALALYDQGRLSLRSFRLLLYECQIYRDAAIVRKMLYDYPGYSDLLVACRSLVE